MLYFVRILVCLGISFLVFVSLSSHASKTLEKTPDFSFLGNDPLNRYACSAIPEKNIHTGTLVDIAAKTVNNCHISAYRASQQLNDRQSLLIDVRTEREFKKISIPGSLNIPDYALKSKAFLKNKKILLINDGSNSFGLNKTCHELRAAGIDTHIVTGGLNSWSKISNVFNHEQTFPPALDQLSPKAFLPEVLYTDVLLLSLSESTTFPELSPQLKRKTHNLLLNKDISSLAQQINELLAQYPATRRLFIYNHDGQINSELKTQLKTYFRQPIFYLTGGAIAFKQYEQAQTAQLKRLKYPPQSLYRCRG